MLPSTIVEPDYKLLPPIEGQFNEIEHLGVQIPELHMKVVSLRALEKNDIPHIHRWMNDTESVSMVGRLPLSLEDVEQQVEKHRKAKDLLLVIENSQSNLLGWVHLSKIEQEHGRAEIGILLAPEYRGHGLGRIAMEMMLNIAFNQLRLHRVYLTTRSINSRGVALYQKIGFLIEGRLREHAFVEGQYHDTIFMGILAHEWDKKSGHFSEKEKTVKSCCRNG